MLFIVESTRQDHRWQAGLLLDEILTARQHTASATHPRADLVRGTFRIGVAGPPGAGKSSLIEVLGMHLVSLGHRVAVVAVDPSSSRTGARFRQQCRHFFSQELTTN